MERGEIIYVTSGEYSYYTVHGVFVVTKEFDVKFEAESHHDECQRLMREGVKYKDLVAWPTWLVNRKLIVEIDASEVYSKDE